MNESPNRSKDDRTYLRLSVMLYRSLDRLHRAVIECGRIGFEESKPTTNEHHASIWLNLSEAQADAALKLKHYSNFMLAEKIRNDPDDEECEAGVLHPEAPKL